MITVHKFVLTLDPTPAVAMPKGAQLLSVGNTLIGMGPYTVELWALVDTREPLVRRRLVVCETGKALGPHVGLVYVDRVILAGGRYVSHVFDTGLEEEITDGD